MNADSQPFYARNKDGKLLPVITAPETILGAEGATGPKGVDKKKKPPMIRQLGEGVDDILIFVLNKKGKYELNAVVYPATGR